MTKDKIVKATHEGELHIGNADLRCAVLEDGTRVLTQSDFLSALGRAKVGSRGFDPEVVDNLPPFLAANNLKPFINNELRRSATPIVFKAQKGGGKSGVSYGYKAELLPEVCDVFLTAKENGALLSNQRHIAKQCEILIRGLATVGITALIDEATGYQEVRDHLALQAILEKYLKDEWSKWTKRFPDEYYKELFRLKGIPYPPTTRNRPSYIGHWTNDIVYSRLAPGVLKKLKELNPRTEKGSRKKKHHQYLTEDFGVPELQEHLSNIVFLMKACIEWKDFKLRLDRANPKAGDTLEMDLKK